LDCLEYKFAHDYYIAQQISGERYGPQSVSFDKYPQYLRRSTRHTVYSSSLIQQECVSVFDNQCSIEWSSNRYSAVVELNSDKRKRYQCFAFSVRNHVIGFQITNWTILLTLKCTATRLVGPAWLSSDAIFLRVNFRLRHTD
jgi:hypothetical protein